MSCGKIFIYFNEVGRGDPYLNLDKMEPEAQSYKEPETRKRENDYKAGQSKHKEEKEKEKKLVFIRPIFNPMAERLFFLVLETARPELQRFTALSCDHDWRNIVMVKHKIFTHQI